MSRTTRLVAFASLLFGVACEQAEAPIEEGWAPEYEIGGADDAMARFSRDGLKVWRPIMADGDRDGTWSPGEALDISVLLSNRSDRDFMNYPGVYLEVDDPAFEIEMPVWYFYGISAGDSYPIGFTVHAPEDVAPGTVVEFTASLLRGACEPTGPRCPTTNPIYFSAVVE